MSRYSVRPCPCGSGKNSRWQFDGRGIELCRTCSECHDAKMARYNPGIFTASSSYDEAVDYETVESDYDDQF